MDQVPLKIHESIKEDFKIELEEAELKVNAYKDFIAVIAKEIGTTQETEAIKARIHTLVAQESKLKDIEDDRPLTRHPFEGIGENINKLLKLLINKLNDKSKKNSRK